MSSSCSPTSTSTQASTRGRCAWAVDETGYWWGQCEYNVDVGMQVLGWIHHDHLRPVVELTDDDGLVDPGKIIALPR